LPCRTFSSGIGYSATGSVLFGIRIVSKLLRLLVRYTRPLCWSRSPNFLLDLIEYRKALLIYLRLRDVVSVRSLIPLYASIGSPREPAASMAISSATVELHPYMSRGQVRCTVEGAAMRSTVVFNRLSTKRHRLHNYSLAEPRFCNSRDPVRVTQTARALAAFVAAFCNWPVAIATLATTLPSLSTSYILLRTGLDATSYANIVAYGRPFTPVATLNASSNSSMARRGRTSSLQLRLATCSQRRHHPSSLGLVRPRRRPSGSSWCSAYAGGDRGRRLGLR
ncbi:hypothetical protein KCU67_g31, partial [Aureobasidium melanogenum]